MKDRIIQSLDQAIAALKANGTLPADVTVTPQVDRTKDRSHGDYATNLALMLAKPAQKKPRELAELLINNLPADGSISRTEIAGPGFINFFQADDLLGRQLSNALADSRLGVAPAHPVQTVVVDYSGPNLAKEMHVGHLRSTIIGDAVARTLEFLGHRVVRQNHVGDWGTQFGMLLALFEELPGDAGQQLSDLEAFYRDAKKRFDASEDFANRARALVVKLQSGDADCLALWKRFNEISLNHCFEVYERLDVSLSRDDVRGESTYNPLLTEVVAQLKQKGLLSESDGASCVFLDQFRNKDGEPLPVIVQKKDGGFLYATSDLAALRYRQKEFDANRMLYFVDQRQALHFQQVFEVARRADFVKMDTDLVHMGFGTMNGPDGKPFKTRDGGTVKLIDLLNEAEQRALVLVKEKNPQMDQSTLEDIARQVGIGAVKYADLSKSRQSDYIFNFDQMLSFDGNTAPYLMYAWTRIASIFRKAGLDSGKLQGTIDPQAEQEIALGNHLVQFAEVLNQVVDKGLPHMLCSYLYELAGLFSSFYENCPVLNADDASVKQSRLCLAALTGRTLEQGLDLLGINTLERM
ncbi:arginine--tRNA ligase [Alcanivorax sp. 1008]|uniref:arginine--tRNA ligase n=1 Tax=Alcanivorax sp. 1008 TaxID=2816853 RepID=UPI001DB38F5D|nr:arginine--tRNA ligase [Alcanivorax sp. 1008]MCC1495768.1 arginine--tRNA ligase [Alcanivorax sp. 1008]